MLGIAVRLSALRCLVCLICWLYCALQISVLKEIWLLTIVFWLKKKKAAR